MNWLARTVTLVTICFLTIVGLSLYEDAEAEAQTSGDPLDSVIFYITTSTVDNADTDEAFTISIDFDSESYTFDSPDHPWDESERGRTERYEYTLMRFNEGVSVQDLDTSDVCIRIEGDDAWLISEIVVVGITITGDYELMGHSTYHMQSYEGQPRQFTEDGSLWLSSDPSDENSASGRTMDGSPC